MNTKTHTSNPLNQYTQINTTLPTPPTIAQATYDDDGNMFTDGIGKTYTFSKAVSKAIADWDKSGKHTYTYGD